MHDWMISKKRYYGLALPIYECQACGHFEVIGSEVELKERAVEGWDEFEGHSPHRPWVDAVKIACRKLRRAGRADQGRRQPLARRRHRAVLDPELPPRPRLLGEVVPGRLGLRELPGPVPQLVLRPARDEHGDVKSRGQPPFKTLLGYALVRDENGEEMHKSKGNAIWFEDAAERMGVDVMRWMFFRTPPGEQPQLRLERRRRDQAQLPLHALEHLLLLRHLRQHRRLDAGPAPRSPSPPASEGSGKGLASSSPQRRGAAERSPSPNWTAGRSPS